MATKNFHPPQGSSKVVVFDLWAIVSKTVPYFAAFGKNCSRDTSSLHKNARNSTQCLLPYPSVSICCMDIFGGRPQDSDVLITFNPSRKTFISHCLLYSASIILVRDIWGKKEKLGVVAYSVRLLSRIKSCHAHIYSSLHSSQFSSLYWNKTGAPPFSSVAWQNWKNWRQKANEKCTYAFMWR